MKSLKKSTPNYCKAVWKDKNKVSNQIGITKKDLVRVATSTKSLVSGRELSGQYYFDSYDKSNGTVFIADSEIMSMTYNVNLSDINRIEGWKDTIPC